MKTKSFRKIFREAFVKILEDQDRVRRHHDGYGDDLEEDQDRVRRHEDGYGDDFEEGKDEEEKALSHAAPSGELEPMVGEVGTEPPGADHFRKVKDIFGKAKGGEGELDLSKITVDKPFARSTDTLQKALERDKQMQQSAYDPVSDEDPMSLKSAIEEKAPPSDKAEEFIKKNKKDFQKRYGPSWKEKLYATAHKMFPEE